MPVPIAEVRFPVQLDRERTILLDANAMGAYEDATAKSGERRFYWDTMLALLKFYEDNALEMLQLYPVKENDGADKMYRRLRLGTSVTKYISMRDLRTLLWASLIEYDAEDNESWPLTEKQVGRLLKPAQSVNCIFALMNAHQGNQPNKAELGEASGAGPSKKQETPAEVAPTQPESGGEPSIALPEAAFA